MTPKEKAQELVNKFQRQIFFHVTDNKIDIEESKGLALIAVDEIIDVADGLDYEFGDELKFWKDVKQEIEKL